MAMPASVIGGVSAPTQSVTSGTKTQASAASTKITSTRLSPAEVVPSLASSSSISFRPPGISSISGLNRTLVSRNQHAAIRTTASGTPTIIHCPKPIWTSCSEAM